MNIDLGLGLSVPLEDICFAKISPIHLHLRFRQLQCVTFFSFSFRLLTILIV